MAGSAIDRYATPEYFPVLLGYRRIWRGTLQPVIGPPEPPTALAGTWLGGTFVDRFVAFYSRIRRAVFHSPTRFEIEVVDRHRADRSYTGTARAEGPGVEAHRALHIRGDQPRPRPPTSPDPLPSPRPPCASS